MTYYHRLWMLLLLAAFFCELSPAHQAPSVQVTFRNARLSVNVQSSADLITVLATVCEVTQSKCEFPATNPGLKVGSFSASGSWQEVVSRLLEGTGLNYIALPPDANGAEGSLLVQGKRQGPEPVSRNNEAQTALSEPVPQPEPVAPLSNTPLEHASADQQPPAESMPVNLGSADNSGEQSPPSGMAAMPHPDAHGQPIYYPIASGNERFLPYPDPNGNPIPAPAVSNERFLPHPDANGNPIPAPPVSTERYLPYPGPDGNPIPAPPVR